MTIIRAGSKVSTSGNDTLTGISITVRSARWRRATRISRAWVCNTSANGMPYSSAWIVARMNRRNSGTSHLTSAPVEVRDLRVLVADTPAEVTGFPEAVTLGPGESQQFPVALSVAEAGAGGSLVVRGTVDSAWHEAASGFGVELAPRLEASEVTLEPAPAEEPAPSTGTLLPILLGAAAVVAVLALLALLLRKRPRMHGTFAITRQGEIVREFMLDAPKLDLTHVAGGAAPELAGTITRAKVNGAEGVKVAAKVGKQKVRTVLADGGSVDVGELTLHWTSQRSRTLGMINDGL